MELTIPVLIINGFLGAGKTTLLRNLLTKHAQADVTPYVIVIDMSELEVDGVVISNTDIVSSTDSNFVSLTGSNLNGASGITQITHAFDSLNFSKAKNPWQIIETSGSTHPVHLIEPIFFSSLLVLKKR
ncbi:GTP-binding protein [Vibrio viridaestus]|uniref:CobW/HypB/UreG nucleotide-binding domain-containing protein n=1 Tax=Vibrio viridaestus TaxID=2487322 RepID=A0A3N9TF46_9VIBR|nr:GTP-binding protein [Vibrio viridaestus]RQW62749.1 hypothetical protein EES38_13570 [Vibrio viridaestus]